MKEKTQAIDKWKMPTVPDIKVLQKRSTPLLEMSKKYAITDEDHFLAAWSLVLRHDEAIKKIEQIFDPFISGLHKMHKMAIAMRDNFLKPLTDSRAGLLTQRMTWRKQQEEIQRKKDEAAAKAVQAAEKKELEKEAKLAERQGDTQTAEVLRNMKETVPVVFMSSSPAVPKQEGSVIRERWVFEIIDPAAVEREYCSPDEKLIRPVVESLGPAAKISGIRIWKEEKEHSRSVSA
jgi:hypothetical protein